jgi:hypothetical protein
MNDNSAERSTFEEEWSGKVAKGGEGGHFFFEKALCQLLYSTVPL